MLYSNRKTVKKTDRNKECNALRAENQEKCDCVGIFSQQQLLSVRQSIMPSLTLVGRQFFLVKEAAMSRTSLLLSASSC